MADVSSTPLSPVFLFDQLRALFSSEQFVEAYRNWLQDPVTVRVFQAIELMARPARVPESAEQAMYWYGFLAGLYRALSLARSLDEAILAIDAAARDAALVPSYGVDGPEPELKELLDRFKASKRQ